MCGFCLLVATCQNCTCRLPCNAQDAHFFAAGGGDLFVGTSKGGSPHSVKKGEEGNPQSKLMTKSPRGGWEGTTKTT